MQKGPPGPPFPKGIGGFRDPNFKFFPLAGSVEVSVTHLRSVTRGAVGGWVVKRGAKRPLFYFFLYILLYILIISW